MRTASIARSRVVRTSQPRIEPRRGSLAPACSLARSNVCRAMSSASTLSCTIAYATPYTLA